MQAGGCYVKFIGVVWPVAGVFFHVHLSLQGGVDPGG